MKKFCFTHALVFVMVFQFAVVSNANAQNCWSALGSGVNVSPTSKGVNAFTTYNGALVVAGGFDTVGGNVEDNIAIWNGYSWSGLGTGISSEHSVLQGGGVRVVAEYNGELYAAGMFDRAGGLAVNNIAKWNGLSWSEVGSGISTYGSWIGALTVYNGLLYVGGSFDSAGGKPVNNIAKWDGTSWSDISGGVKGTVPQSSFVQCLTVHNGTLYVGGEFDSAGAVAAGNLAIWNDSSWRSFGQPNGTVNAIAVYKQNLYIGGIFEEVGNGVHVRGIASWNDSSWSDLVGGIDLYGRIESLCDFNGSLIVGGTFNTAGDDSANNIAQWNGTVWANTGSGVIGYNNSYMVVQAMDTFQGTLFVGGNFIQAGNVGANNIAEYTCPTAITEIPVKNQIQLYPNPTSGVLNISIDNIQDKATIQIYNLLGQNVIQSNLNAGKNELNLTGQASGTYLYRVTGADGESLGAGSFVIQ